MGNEFIKKIDYQCTCLRYMGEVTGPPVWGTQVNSQPGVKAVAQVAHKLVVAIVERYEHLIDTEPARKARYNSPVKFL